MSDLITGLQKKYYVLLAPPLILLFAVFLIKLFAPYESPGSEILMKIISPAILVLSVITAIAFPIFYRILFVKQNASKNFISINDFMNFEKTLLTVVSASAYCVLISYIFNFNRFYLTFISLTALYGLYFFYPSNRKLKREMDIFRVR